MKRWSSVLIFCAVLAAVWASARLAPGAGRIRSLGDAASVVVYGDGGATRWAPGYEEGRFTQVRPGMCEREVVALLGPPLRESCRERGHGRTLGYSSGPALGGARWWARTVEIGAGGHVTKVESGYRVD
jgi:hypothetical protein